MMGSKQKVLIVHNYYQIPGGEDAVVAKEKKMLEDHGHEVILYTRDNSELKKMSIFRKLLMPFTTIYNPKTARDIKRIIKDENIDIVHVHNTLNLISPSVYYAALKMKKPIVQTIHNFRLLCPGATFYREGHVCEDCVEHGLGCALKYNCYRGSRLQTLICVISTIFHRMTGIYGKINYICLTEFNRDKLQGLKQIKPERVFVKPNFVESVEDFSPKEQRENQFVFAGRLEKLKGIDLLLEAWKQMGKSAPKLIVCGTGPMDDWCKKFIEKHEVNVELRGFVPNTEVRKLIADSKALILPTQCYEGFPVSIVEAYSVGTPVICSDLGNCGSIVKKGVTGWKFSPGEQQELIEAVCRVHCERDLYNTIYEMYQKDYTEIANYSLQSKIYSAIGTQK